MQLDHTQIAIRERGFLDILDLSLRVITAFGGPLFLCLATMIIPLMIINFFLIGWMTQTGDEVDSYARYLWTMTLLVIIQAPLVSTFVTPFLGNAMFLEAVSPRLILQVVRHSCWGLFLNTLLLRGVLFSWLLAWLIPRGSDYTGWDVCLILLAAYTLLFRAARPFINEIILLERNPLRSHHSNVITVGRRSSALHGPNAGDLISRWMGSALVAFVLANCLLFTMWFLWGMLLFDWNWGPFMLHLCFPLALWMVAAYFSVVRFLSYLDLRIRREGWEVELIMRAAAANLLRAA